MFGYGYGVGITPNVASLGIAYDADAAAYFTAAGITDQTQKDAYNAMVVSLKANSLYTKFQALYPFLGGSASTHKYNAINPLDTNAAFRLSFTGGWTHSSNGALPNGTTGYADTFFTPSVNFSSANSTHLSFYSRTAANATHRDFGCYVNADNPCMCLGSNITPLLLSDNLNFNTNRINSAVTNTQKLLINTRTSSTVHKAFRNATQIGSTGTTAVGALPTISIYLGASNATAFGVSNYSTKQYAFASIGTGLSDAEVTIFNTIVETFQTALSRNV
jgi:hypothetical protein